MKVLDEEEGQLKASDLFALSENVLAAERAGRDLLKEMAKQVDQQIQVESEHLHRLRTNAAPQNS